MTKICAAIFVVLLWPLHAIAQDRLDPEASILGGDEFIPSYTMLVASVLEDAFDRDVVVRMIGLPSFGPEYAVGIRKRGGQFEIFSVQPTEQLWGYGNNHSSPASRVPLKKCQVAISDSLADKISMLWKKMLLQVRYGDQPREGLDGETFHFAMRNNASFMAGQIWSPAPASNASTLVDIGDTMQEICMKNNSNLIPNLEEKVRKLLSTLN